MLPKTPPRSGQVGFIYVPPYRIQGISVAGEQTVVQIPELDVAFDIGMCPRIALSSQYVALSHGHMDHVGGLPYYFSQRMFQKMGVGKCVCHPSLVNPIKSMMGSWVALEGQRTPYEIIPLEPDEKIEVKNNIHLQGIEVSHAAGSMAYALIEHRSKLKSEFFDVPQEKLRELKSGGTEITRTMEIPLVAYTGDTEFGPYLFRDEFAKAKIVICECTFLEPDHESRAKVGKHLHIEDLKRALSSWEAEAVVIIHVSRRTNLATARDLLETTLGEDQMERIHFLMDHRTNRQRYERQEIEAGLPSSARHVSREFR